MKNIYCKLALSGLVLASVASVNVKPAISQVISSEIATEQVSPLDTTLFGKDPGCRGCSCY